MKVKTSVTLSQELVDEIDSLTPEPGKRSAFIEKAVREYVRSLKRARRKALAGLAAICR